MEFEVTQEKLSKALNSVSRITAGKSMLPILSNVLIRVQDGKVSLTTTNLDMATVAFVPSISAKDGDITVPANPLAEFVSILPRNEKVKLAVSDTKITITAGKYSSVINGTSADDFPELPEINEESAVIYKMPVDEFKTGVSEVIIAVSSDQTRPALTGVYFNTYDEILAIAATDGYRLAEKKLIKNVKSEISVIVPAVSLREVLSSISDDMEEVEISFNSDLVRFRLGDTEIVSKLIDASYPAYRRLLPESSETNLELDREEFIRAVKLASPFARLNTGGSIICEAVAPNTFSVKSVANELGENSSDIETEVNTDGKISMNLRFLLDALNSLEDKTIRVDFSGGQAPFLLRNKQNDNYSHIVMPLNI